MNEIINKFLLAGDKFMPEIHLRQLNLHIVLVVHLLKNKKRIKKFKEIGNSRYMYQNELDKAYFQHDMSYEDFKDLNRRTFADKVLRDKAFNIAKDSKYDGYQRGLISMVYKFFDKKTCVSSIKNENISNKRKVHSPFIDNIWVQI